MMSFDLRLMITLLYSLFIQDNYISFFVNGINCNVELCGSVVTKCQLMQSCPCLLDDADCQKKCLSCLSKLFPSCCSCVELCGTDNENISVQKSLVGLFNGMPQLFNTFVMENVNEDDDGDGDNDDVNDDTALWTILKFPAYKNLKKILPNSMEQLDQKQNQVNCTVLYFTTCVPHKICAQNCESMGASSYRWFVDGCCECAGSNCLNYGLNEHHCTACPPDVDNIDVEHYKYAATGAAAAATATEEDDDDDDGINFDDLDKLEFGEDGINDISNNKNKNVDDRTLWEYDENSDDDDYS